MSEEQSQETTETVETVETTETTTEQNVETQETKFVMPDKFSGKSAEEIAQAYVELEKMRKGSEEEQETTEEPAPEELEEVVSQLSDDDFDTFTEEFEANGDLSEASYEKLAAMGIPKNIVKNYVNGLHATQQAQIQDIYNSVGGEEEFKALQKYAAQNLSDKEKESIEKIRLSGDIEAYKFAFNGIAQKYKKAKGSSTNFQKSTGGAGGGEVFESLEQVISAKQDPRYFKTKDPAYIAKVTKMENEFYSCKS